VKERLAADRDVERDVWVRLRAARVVLLVLLGRYAKKVPLNTRVEVLQLDADLQRVQIADARLVLDDVLQVDLRLQRTIIQPTAYISPRMAFQGYASGTRLGLIRTSP